MSLDELLDQWELVERDLADVGVDVGDPVLMASRSWRWLTTRIIGLFDRPPVGYVVIGSPLTGYANVPVWGSRIQQHFMPTPDESKRASQ